MLTVRMQHGDATIAQLPETVDYDNAYLVGAQCEDLVNSGCITLVVDASKVTYMDSSGISMLVTLWRILDQRGGVLRVAALSAHYEQVWNLLGLEQVFPVFPTVDAALQTPAAGDVSGIREECTTPDMPAACAARAEKTPGWVCRRPGEVVGGIPADRRSGGPAVAEGAGSRAGRAGR
ncbi:STAS domain-containing protein [Streptomyces pseudogriseolus]|uniref:STAS domain-containing protein n=1 Tax=Streptomyces pseudogriseolus TaxID=36817 RepID=UPI00347B7E74